MWKYRGEIIFLLALAFALKALIQPDIAAVGGVVLFLGAHYLDRYFSTDRSESKVNKCLQGYEEEIKILKNDISRLNMAIGLRSGK